MNEIRQALVIDLPSACQKTETLIRTTMERLGRDGAVVGLSGGLDSAVAATLTARSLGADKVHLLNLPEQDSRPIHRKHAKQLARQLGIRLTTRSITPILWASGTYRLLPLTLLPGIHLRSRLVSYARSKLLSGTESVLVSRFRPAAGSWVAKSVAYAMAKHRIRMVVLYQYAELHNLLVVGAANRTEWLTGTFSKWGIDHCADVMPLLHLYRSQVEQIAEYVQVPASIRNKAADPDVLPGIHNKGELLGGFDTVDQILCGIERGVDQDVLDQVYGKANVEHILALWELSRHLRESPYLAHNLRNPTPTLSGLRHT